MDRQVSPKVEIAYRVFDRSGRLVVKRKVVSKGKVEKVLNDLEQSGDVYEVIGTREVE